MQLYLIKYNFAQVISLTPLAAHEALNFHAMKQVPMPLPLMFTTRGAVFGAMFVAMLPSYAQTPLDGALLGVHESALETAFPALQRATKPARGPRGLRGHWELPPIPVSGLPFTTTFYVKDKRVQRIEQRWSESQDCKLATFVTLMADMTSKYGPGLHSHDAAGQVTRQRSAIWEAGAFDVTAHFTQSPAQCAILVVYKTHIEKDAAEL